MIQKAAKASRTLASENSTSHISESVPPPLGTVLKVTGDGKGQEENQSCGIYNRKSTKAPQPSRAALCMGGGRSFQHSTQC